MGEDLYHTIRAFAEVQKVPRVVDSSKRAAHLLALIEARPEDVNLKVIHLVRDGRAVLYSKMKRSEEFGLSFRPLSAVRGWVYNNLQIGSLRKLLPGRESIRIRYEDLCQDTESVIRRVCQQLEITYDPAMVRISDQERHSVGGSPHRFKWKESTPIRLDERWKGNLPGPCQWLYWPVAGWLHKFYGY